jgi:hypothetical protein
MKIKKWIYIKNLGDGSCSAELFESEEDAEKAAENHNERFCDDIYPEEIEVDDTPELISIRKENEKLKVEVAELKLKIKHFSTPPTH